MELDHSTRLKDIAAEAATAFLDRGEPLTSKIASLADRHDLNPEQATRVCEFANHAVWQSMRKHASTVEFPIAEPEKVRAKLGHKTVVAMMHLTPKAQASGGREKTAGLDTNNGRVLDEWEQREESQNRVIAYERAKVAFENQQDVVQGQALRFMDGLERFTQFCKEAAMDGLDLDQLLLQAASDSKVAKHPELMWKMAYCMKTAGLLADVPVTLSDKTMAALAPEALSKVAQEVEPEHVVPGLHMAGNAVHYVNGEHKAWREIDTLEGEYGSLDNQRSALDEARRDMLRCKSQFENGMASESSRAGGSV